jgi:2-polyprenyl-3-methyl-5-hydroxy-6-metoxy-1,4-benzoquinol methylase
MSRLRERRGTDINIRSEPQMREYRAIVARIERDRPRRLLDWGCGWGQATKLLLDRGLDVTAFDYDPGVGGDAVIPLPRYPAIQAHRSSDPVRLPFETDAFDAVLSLGVLEHVAHPDESLEELKRVLEPGGTLYIYKLPNRYSYLEKLARLIGLYFHGAAPHDAVYTKRSALELMRAHGFEIREFRRANMLPLTLEGRFATGAGRAIWVANRALARAPVLNLLATNLELVVTAPA